MSSSFSLLRDAETKLKELVRTSMADAMATSDHAQVERLDPPETALDNTVKLPNFRFFKIFPLLNLHKEGLQLFSSHLRRQVNEGDCPASLSSLLPGNHRSESLQMPVWKNPPNPQVCKCACVEMTIHGDVQPAPTEQMPAHSQRRGRRETSSCLVGLWGCSCISVSGHGCCWHSYLFV